MAYLGSEDLAGDSLHDVWLRLATSQAAEVRNPGAYVFRMACNLAVDGLRQGWREVGQDGDDAGLLADDAPGPAQVAEARSELLSCMRALQACPAAARPSCWPAAWKTCRRAKWRCATASPWTASWARCGARARRWGRRRRCGRRGVPPASLPVGVGHPPLSRPVRGS